jgi:hypothetical protein
MTAAMLVLEPIFEADLPPEIYAYRRVVDRRVLHLIKMWLDCPVEETDDRGPEDTHDRGARQTAVSDRSKKLVS